MSKKAAMLRLMLVSGAFLVVWTTQGVVAGQKASVPKPQDTAALGEDEVKKLLFLIDTNQAGKITKQQWMKFMEAEFDRLDKNKTGELDAKELAQSQLRVSPFAKLGK